VRPVEFVQFLARLAEEVADDAAGDVLDDVVWLPMNSPGCHIHSELGAVPGSTVRLTSGGAA